MIGHRNDAVQAYGGALVDDPERIDDVNALGLDETWFVRRGERHRKNWSTSIVDVRLGFDVSYCGVPALVWDVWLPLRAGTRGVGLVRWREGSIWRSGHERGGQGGR